MKPPYPISPPDWLNWLGAESACGGVPVSVVAARSAHFGLRKDYSI
jgi:hypothetical protein